MSERLKHLLFLFAIAIPCISFAQSEISENITADHLRTIQFHTNEKYSKIPVYKLGESFRISFDDINGDEADYYYRISHHNFDWTTSSLYKNEYLNGFDEIRILNYENSFNTLQLYSNYQLSIPNEDTRGFKVSGNYIIEIYDDNDQVVLTRKFIVYEPLATVKVFIKRSRNLKFINSKQSVQFEINSSDDILRNPRQNLKTLVIQNNDFKNSITNLTPQYTIANTLVYKYDQESSFGGGNEYLSFDSKDIRASTVSTQSIDLKEIYHNYLYPNIVRSNRNYSYNPDINGSFVVRNLGAEDNSVEADYAWMHFVLKCHESIGDDEIHIYGNFNNYTLDDSTRLKYDKESGLYYNKRLFKQGFYNYKYVLLKSNNTIDHGFISGDFDETENEYTVIPYYRGPGARYDRVIGKGIGNSSSITN